MLLYCYLYGSSTCRGGVDNFVALGPTWTEAGARALVTNGIRLDSVLGFTPRIDELKLALDGLAALGVPVQWFCGFTRSLAVIFFSVARNWREQLAMWIACFGDSIASMLCL